MTRTSEAPARRRSRLPTPVTLVVGLFLLAACGALPPGVAAPPTPGPTPLPTLDAPDDRRHVGNWNVIHRVDVPEGWTLSQVQVGGSHELSSWRRNGDEESLCGVSVWEPQADFMPQPSGGEPVEVGGRPGLFLGKPDGYESLSGLWWHYRPDAWASLECGERGRDEYVQLAERVTFRPTEVLLPFRLTAVPAGYTVDWLGWDQAAGTRTFELALARPGDDAEEFPLAPQITMAPAAHRTRSVEEITVNGRVAFLDAKARTLCFPVSGWQACIEGGSDSNPPEPDGDARLRSRMLAVAEVLDFAPAVEDPSTWFDGTTAAAA